MCPTASAPRRKRPGRYHHGDLRRALVDEALRTIAADGVDALTLRGVGQALGVSRTALYRHFADKTALLATVATEGFRRLTADTLRAWEEGGRGRAGFQAMGAAYVRFGVASPAHYRVMFGRFVDARGGRYPDLEAEGAGAFQVLVSSLVEQQRDGSVRRDDPVHLARFVWATVHGVAMLAIDGRLGDENAVDALTTFAVERIWSAVCATPPSGVPRGRSRSATARAVRR
jgi:AcrR family transcriptional regulator